MSTDNVKACERTPQFSNQSSQGKQESCLTDLPSFNMKNFSLYDRSKTLNKRPIQYIAVKKDTDPQPQVIVSDRRSLLVKYYSKKWHYVKGHGAQGNVGCNTKKRDVSDIENNEEPGPSNKQLRTS